jgi:hypothetical protein
MLRQEGTVMENSYEAQGWPTLEQQLASANVIPGSALEKIIRDNQDLEILDPAEVNDVWKLPPWIRVYFRKKHPEIKFQGPRIGYPLALKELYSWMLRHQDSVPADNQPVTEPKR